MRFQFTAIHIPGADLKIADTLSRAPLQEVTEADRQLQKGQNNRYGGQELENT